MIRAILALLLLTGTLTAGELRTAAISTGDFPDNGVLVQSVWTNNTGVAVYIKSIEFFMGMSGDGMGDFSCSLWRISDTMELGFKGWDHYTHSTGINSNNASVPMAGNYYTVAAGDGVFLQAVCTGYAKHEEGYQTLPNGPDGPFLEYGPGVWVPCYNNWCLVQAIIYYSTTTN